VALDTGGGPTPADALRAPASARDVPTRAEGVQLLGNAVGSGYRVPPALVRRSDGQIVQVTTLLYHVLEGIDGRRDLNEVAAAVSAASGRTVSAENIRQLLDDNLRPSGLVAMADGTQPTLQRANPLLALRFKVGVTSPERTRAVTAPFARLFWPIVVIPVVLAFAAITWWTLLDKGLASATYQAFNHPGLLFLVLAVTVLSAGFHEFGHAAAARYGGATPGVMGAGLYLIWPAFYTDVTDSYRLGRAGRIRTDLGGLYFNAIVVIATQAAWLVTRDDALLLLVATQVLQMLRQLMPVVRFDGYHVLADTTGIPDLFHWIGPVLAGLLPWRWKDSKARALKPWARVVITAWVLGVVPMLAFALFTMVVSLPRVVGTAWTACRAQRALMGYYWHHSDVVAALAHGLAALVVLLPLAAGAVLLYRLCRSLVRSLLRRTSGHPIRRALAFVLVAVMIAGLAWSWWPRPGQYDPIKPWERGTLTDAVAVARPGPQFGVGWQDEATVVWPADKPVPTRDHPQLAVVLIPKPGSTTTTPATSTTGQTDDSPGTPTATDPTTWVFPVNLPLATGPGDNHALAVNTTDNSVVYDTAFAMVWDTGGGVADNTNQAYALANCTNCAAISVAFQVVYVVGQTSAAVPENVAVAINSGCVGCLTYALAVQLFVTLDGPLTDAQTAALQTLWDQIQTYGQHIADVPLSDIQSQLDDYEQQILAIVAPDMTSHPTSSSTGPTASASASTSPPAGAETPSPAGTEPTSPSQSASASSSAGPTPTSATGSPSAPPSTPTTSSTPPNTTLASAGPTG
jgi:putative peptide zinc metalloprotease protein